MTKHQTPTPVKIDPYARITDRILAELEQGVTPWTKPWSADTLAGRVTRPLRVTGEAYTGINVILLWMEACSMGYASSTWMTYRQAQALGGQVRRSESGTQIAYYGSTTKRCDGDSEGGTTESNDSDTREIRFLKTYTVFNVAQIEGLPERFAAIPVEAPALPACERVPHAEEWFEGIGARVAHGGVQAFYAAGKDRIQLPPFESFHDAHGYYTTRGHETVHWTRHPARLDRKFGRERFGDEGYAREELVAELGAAFLAADLGLALEPRADHASYIGHWIKVLQNDKRAIVSAAAHAERAIKYLHGLQAIEQREAA